MSDEPNTDAPEPDEVSEDDFGRQPTSVEPIDAIEGVDEADYLEEFDDPTTAPRGPNDEVTGTEIIDTERLEEALERDESLPALIELSGHRAGETTHLEPGEILLGRNREKVDIAFRDESVSRVHAAVEYSAEEGARIRDLDSSNGTFVNGTRIDEARSLSDGDRLALGKKSILKYRLLDSYEDQYQRELYESTIRDELTGARSRAYLEEQMDAETSFADRHEISLALLLFDIDHFKGVNDLYGHVAGDEVLAEFAAVVEDELRNEDLFARYGGDEFAAMLRETDRETAVQVAERVQKSLDERRFELDDGAVAVTASVGVASYDMKSMPSVKDWLRAADSALYDAKEAGRNCVRVYSEED